MYFQDRSGRHLHDVEAIKWSERWRPPWQSRRELISKAHLLWMIGVRRIHEKTCIMNRTARWKFTSRENGEQDLHWDQNNVATAWRRREGCLRYMAWATSCSTLVGVSIVRAQLTGWCHNRRHHLSHLIRQRDSGKLYKASYAININQPDQDHMSQKFSLKQPYAFLQYSWVSR